MFSSPLLSLREVANSLPSRPHVNSVRRWILEGSRGRKLSAKLIGGRWFTSPEALEEFLETPANRIRSRSLTASQRAATEQARRMGL